MRLLAPFIAAGVTATLSAFQPALDPASLADAIQLGQSTSDSLVANFNAPYHVIANMPPVDSIDIVTPFRRVVLDAESHARSGDRTYGQRLALATLGDDPSRVDVVADMTFNPQNNYVGVPDFAVTMRTEKGDLLQPRTVDRISRFGPKVGQGALPYPYSTGTPQIRGKAPLLGGMVIATFDGKAIDPKGVYVVMVTGRNGEPAEARIDFGRLR